MFRTCEPRTGLSDTPPLSRLRHVALDARAIANAVFYAISQPDDVVVNDMIIRSVRAAPATCSEQEQLLTRAAAPTPRCRAAHCVIPIR